MTHRAIELKPVWALMLACALLSGCTHKPELMPTPNVYTHQEWNPFAAVPPALQGSKVEVLYVTDRVPEKDDKAKASPDKVHYGLKRSRSAAFGVAELQIGDKDITWEQLVTESRSATRDKKLKLDLNIVATRELGRFAPTPPSLVIFGKPGPPTTAQQAVRDAQQEAEKRFLAQLESQLAKTPRKEVFLFIHGFNVDFDGSIRSIGELWHFLGREGVPVAYSWPAGQGTLRAYEYTNQSAEFTIFHFKQALRLIASCPAVEKIHLIAHSRGTGVATNGVRDLVLESRHDPDGLRKLKLGTCALCAGDLDIDVVIERDVTEQIGRAVDQAAVYVFKNDQALSFSNWLSGGSTRLGSVHSDIFSKEEIDSLRANPRIQFIDARISKPGSMGHSYFHANPAVSSDLILFLRYHLPPSGKDGRPLGVAENGFWIIGDEYPGSMDVSWFTNLGQGEKATATPVPTVVRP